MGRTNGKLLKFVKDGLQDESFCNLNWENRCSQIFSVKIPRYDESKDLTAYESILKEWYNINDRNKHYPNYKVGKSVFQAAIKSSPYFVTLGFHDKKRYYRFATKDEENEKRRLKKLKSMSAQDKSEGVYLQPVSEDHELFLPDEPNLQPIPLFSANPPSPSSSGYESGNDDVGENMKIDEHKMSEETEILDILNDLFNNPDSFIKALNNVGLDNEDVSINDIMEDRIDVVPGDNIKLNDTLCNQQANENDFKPVEELFATEVQSSEILNTYWMCTKKVNFDSVLLLICEKQVIQDENLGFTPGQIYLNNAIEPGESYNLQKMFELDEKCFLFLSRSN